MRNHVPETEKMNKTYVYLCIKNNYSPCPLWHITISQILYLKNMHCKACEWLVLSCCLTTFFFFLKQKQLDFQMDFIAASTSWVTLHSEWNSMSWVKHLGKKNIVCLKMVFTNHTGKLSLLTNRIGSSGQSSWHG